MRRRRRPSDEDRARAAKFRRGLPVATRSIGDRKLRGQLRASEKLAADAAAQAAQAEAWLLPNEAGGLEAEGLERTWRFSQVPPLPFPGTLSRLPWHVHATRSACYCDWAA